MPVADPLIASFVVMMSLTLVSVCTITDVLDRRIPNHFLAMALSVALICHGIDSGVSGILGSIGGLGVGLAILLPLYMLGGTGAGDVKLLGVVGALLGAKAVMAAGAGALISGGLLGGAWILWVVFRAHISALIIRYAPFERFAGMLEGSDISPEPEIRGTSIPYAPAIAIGTYISIWYFDLLKPLAGP